MGVREENEKSTEIVTSGAVRKRSRFRFVPTAMELCRPIIKVLRDGRQEHADLRKEVANQMNFPLADIKKKYPPKGQASFANNFHVAMQHLHRNNLITQSGKFLSAVLDLNRRALPIPEIGGVDPLRRNISDVDLKWPVDLDFLKLELPRLPIDALLAYFNVVSNYKPPKGKKRMECIMNSVIVGLHVQGELINRGIIREDGTVNKAALAQALGHTESQLAFHWPSTKNTGGDGSMIMPDVPDVSPLKLMGYTVGKNGLEQWKRRRLLTKAFKGPIPDAPEIEEWGEPSTSGRLKKMAYHLAMLTRIDKRKRTQDMSEAIRMKEDDLEFLRVNFYVGSFDGEWRYPSP